MRVKRTAPLQIIFRNLDPSGSVETKIQERLTKLGSSCEHIAHIASCRVTVEALNGGAHTPMRYHIGIVAQVWDRELVANCESDGHYGGAYIYVPIHDAFDAIRRQILQCANDRSTDLQSDWMPAMHNLLHAEGAGLSTCSGF